MGTVNLDRTFEEIKMHKENWRDEIGCREMMGRMICVIALAVFAALIMSGCTRLTYKDKDTKATYTTLRYPWVLDSPEASYTPSNGTFNVEVIRKPVLTEKELSIITEAAVKFAMKNINPVP